MLLFLLEVWVLRYSFQPEEVIAGNFAEVASGRREEFYLFSPNRRAGKRVFFLLLGDTTKLRAEKELYFSSNIAASK